jgi:stearoyl-CoA desaturase (Delta-9 desaturase)
LNVYIRGYHWPHILFFTLTPVAAILATVWLLASRTVPWPTWILAGSMFLACGMAITAGYHRLFTHRSYRARWPVRLYYLLFGAAAFEGSAYWWACEHRYHHQYEETPKDPYGVHKGFWYAHVGWLFTSDQEPSSYDNVKDLDTDPLVRFQTRFFVPLALLVGFALPIGLATLWGDALGGFVIAGLLRMVLTHHTTFFINSIAHYWGHKSYWKGTSARDSWLAAFLTLGEGFHNYHHKFPYDYRNGHRWCDWDPTKWFIWTLAEIRLAFDLRRALPGNILRARSEHLPQR